MKKLLLIISFLNIFFSCKEVKQNITSKSEQTIEDKGQDKIFVESIELKIDSIKLKNEYYKIGRISDSDGYTNLRERPNSKSKILSKIVDGEYFFYNPIKFLEWSAIKTLKKEEGYIHNSRIVEIKNDKLISVSIFNYILGDIESTKDTIVNISSFNDSATFLPNDFNYEKIEKNEFINDSTIIFSDANSKITISKYNTPTKLDHLLS